MQSPIQSCTTLQMCRTADSFYQRDVGVGALAVGKSGKAIARAAVSTVSKTFEVESDAFSPAKWAQPKTTTVKEAASGEAAYTLFASGGLAGRLKVVVLDGAGELVCVATGIDGFQSASFKVCAPIAV